MTRLVPCPSCKSLCPFDKALNAYRPFCSERCRNIDLGAWASGGYTIPSAPENDDEAIALGEALMQSPMDHTDKPAH
jgi:uncharacterized protein